MSETAEKYIRKEDCFAFNKNETKGCSCSCLRELFCEKEHCKFYKKDINGKYDWQLKRGK